jgi:hypothetical protein
VDSDPYPDPEWIQIHWLCGSGSRSRRKISTFLLILFIFITERYKTANIFNFLCWFFNLWKNLSFKVLLWIRIQWYWSRPYPDPDWDKFLDRVRIRIRIESIRIHNPGWYSLSWLEAKCTFQSRGRREASETNKISCAHLIVYVEIENKADTASPDLRLSEPIQEVEQRPIRPKHSLCSPDRLSRRQELTQPFLTLETQCLVDNQTYCTTFLEFTVPLHSRGRTEANHTYNISWVYSTWRSR